MLERYAPWLYGWLVWGGGFQTLRTIFGITGIAAYSFLLIAIGVVAGFWFAS